MMVSFRKISLLCKISGAYIPSLAASWNNDGISIPIIECWPKESGDFSFHSCGPSQGFFMFFPACGNPNFESNEKNKKLSFVGGKEVWKLVPEVLSNHLDWRISHPKSQQNDKKCDPGKLHEFNSFKPMCCQWCFGAKKWPKGDHKRSAFQNMAFLVFQHGVVQKALSSISLQGNLNMFCAICMATNQKRDDTDSPWQHQLAKRARA